MLDDESYSTAESQDLVRKRFIRSWGGLVDGFKVRIRSRGWAFIVPLNDSLTGYFHGEQLWFILYPRS